MIAGQIENIAGGSGPPSLACLPETHRTHQTQVRGGAAPSPLCFVCLVPGTAGQEQNCIQTVLVRSVRSCES
jgi:hypothetical protein